MSQIISRAAWGARHRAGFGIRSLGRLERWLHHSAGTSAGPGATLAADAATIRALEDIGQARFGGGISYTLCVTEAGRIFEGTGITRVGAHTAGRNTGSAGIVLVGNYESRAPTPAQLAALVWLLHHGVTAGWWTAPTLTGGHRTVSATACPGAAAYALIPAINTSNPTTITAVPEEDIMGLTRAENQADMAAAIAPLATQLATLHALARPVAFRITNTDGAYLPVGDVLLPLTAPQQAGIDARIVALPASDPAWRRRIVGPPTQAFRQTGDASQAVWYPQEGKRVHVDAARYAADGKPPLRDLDPSHGFWDLPICED